MENDGFDALSKIGYRGVPGFATLDSRDSIIK